MGEKQFGRIDFAQGRRKKCPFLLVSKRFAAEIAWSTKQHFQEKVVFLHVYDNIWSENTCPDEKERLHLAHRFLWHFMCLDVFWIFTRQIRRRKPHPLRKEAASSPAEMTVTCFSFWGSISEFWWEVQFKNQSSANTKEVQTHAMFAHLSSARLTAELSWWVTVPSSLSLLLFYFLT